jgi:hypothetical protein
MVLVVGVAISTYYRSGLDSAGDTSAASAEEKGTELAPLSAQDAQTESAATAQTTTTAVAGGVPADDATVMTEAGTPGITTTFGETARAADAMLENLADRLSTAASGDSGVPPVAWLRMEVPAGEGEVIASFVASLIGLAPLSREAWMGGLPTYAALISPDDVKRLALALGVDAAWMTSTPEDEQSAPTALVDLIDAGQALPVLKTGLAGDDSGQVTWEQSPPQTGPAATEDLAVMVLMMNEGQPAPAQ